MLIDTSKETRLKLYKLFSIEKFRKVVSKSKFKAPVFVQKLGKSYQTATKSDITQYVEKNCKNSLDPVLTCFVETTLTIIRSKFKKYYEVLNEVNAMKREEVISEDTVLNKYKDEFDACDTGLDFAEFLNYIAEPGDEVCEKQFDEEKIYEIASLKEKIENLKSDISKLKEEKKEDNAKYKAKLKEYTNNISDLNKKLKKSNDRFSVVQSKTTISKVLSCNITGKTYQEIYESLDKLEKSVSKEDKYDELEKILASKFALLQIMKTEKNTNE